MGDWKRLKGKNAEGKNFRKLLRRKQSSAKISKISRNTLKSSKSDIFYLLRNLLKYLLRTFFSSARFSEVFALCVFTLWLFSGRNRFLQKSAVFCGFLRKSAVSCGFLRKSATPKSLDLQSEPKISENLQKSAKMRVPGPVSPFCCLPFGAP